MQILRIKIYQPSVQYRIPFSYQRRFTYPIPPFSTVKGFICNIMGIRKEEDFNSLIEGLSIGVFGKYESLSKEYTWLRNLSAKSHKDRFVSSTNRKNSSGFIEHPGGQMPVLSDVLNEVKLIIYFYHNNEEKIDEILKACKNPDKRISKLCLGRSEDLIVIEELKILNENDLEEKNISNIYMFTWIPEEASIFKDLLPETAKEDYISFYNNTEGTFFNLPTVYSIKEGMRVFEKFIKVKLFEGGGIPKFTFNVDKETNLPMILAKL